MKRVQPVEAVVGEEVTGTVFRCPGCDGLFIGPRNALYCSSRCRMRVQRRASGDTVNREGEANE